MIDINLNSNWLEQRVNISADENAVLTSNGNISFRQLAAKVDSYAELLDKQNIKSGDRTGLLFTNSVDFIICIFALWQLGAVPIPFNFRLSSHELTAQTEFAGIKLLIVEEKLNAKHDRNIFSNKYILSENIETKPDDSIAAHIVDSGMTALILFTSGSTDKPKAVELSFTNLFFSAENIDKEINFSRNDIFLASLPFYHIGGFSIIVRAILSGGSIALPESIKTKSILSGLKSFKPSIISLVPTQLKRIIDADEKPHPNLRCVFLGGGAIDKLIIEKALELGWLLYIVYGSTETSSMVTMLKPNEIAKRLSCAGKPIGRNRVLIKDDEGGILPPNRVGRIHIISKSVMKNYLNSSERISGDEYRTDDTGSIDDEGYLYISGRSDDIIISGGENINCREVDHLIQSHPNIADSFSFGLNDSEWGQVLCSAVVVNEKDSYSEKKLKAFLKAESADYKIPKIIFEVEHLPKNDLGKIERKKLLAYLKANH